MNDRPTAALFVLLSWWLSTGIVLRMVWLGRSTLRIATFTAIGISGLIGVHLSSRIESTGAAYVAFGSALAAWGWNELMFLLGIVTGPRKIACPHDARGWARFRMATAAVIHHEIALTLTLFAVIAITWRQPNQVGTYTFAVLWVMRLSAKLNVFLGVRNISEQFVPNHLRYMLSYFRRAPMNWLMPLSLAFGGALVFHLASEALADGGTRFALVGRTLVATLLALAVLEHVFLALPVPDALLWRWATRVKNRSTVEPPADLPFEAP